MTDAEFEAEIAAELAAFPDNHDWRTYYGDAVPSLKELFATPVVGDGLIGDTLLGYDDYDDDEANP